MDIKVFGKKNCSFCDNTHALLEGKELPYEYFDVEASEENYNTMREYAPEGYKTVPVVVVDGNFVGGYIELRKYLTA